MNHQQLPFPHSGNARARQVAEYLGVHISTIWRYARRPDFPQPQTLTDGVTVFDAAKIREWNAQRLAHQPDATERKGVRLAKIRAGKRRERERLTGGKHA
ncbi:TPA: AlpA family phage regulatory protein [Salmonella enterica]|nr:AlpA family phage regulatory protein [Salmonella enterica]